MKKFFSIGEAARLAGTTGETLRHYDRLGLVRPSHKDEWTKYRYYSERDIVRLNTVRALRQMDLSLGDIKTVLEYDELEKIVAFLSEAEKKADEKMKKLELARDKIRSVRADYEAKLRGVGESGEAVEEQLFPERVILLSDRLEKPELENLWSYLSHFYGLIAPGERERFSFEDRAGIYTAGGRSRMFAVCTRYGEAPGLKLLPAGVYLCAPGTEDDWQERLSGLVALAREKHGVEPSFTLRQVVVSGILQWNYQLQVPLTDKAPAGDMV